MITKAILIKPADKWLVRVWESDEPNTQVHPFVYEDWLNSYKEYEVHPEYVDRFVNFTIENLHGFYESNEWLKNGIDLKPELIGFKENEFPKWSGIFKTYAILKEQDEKRIMIKSVVHDSDNGDVGVERFNITDEYIESIIEINPKQIVKQFIEGLGEDAGLELSTNKYERYFYSSPSGSQKINLESYFEMLVEEITDKYTLKIK